MRHLAAVELNPDEFPRAWALVRTVEPDLQLDSWNELGEALIDRGGGVIGLESPDRTLHGLATYEIVERALFGSMLNVATFVTFELTGRGHARQALLKALHELAEALGCTGAIISEEAGRQLRSRDH